MYLFADCIGYRPEKYLSIALLPKINPAALLNTFLSSLLDRNSFAVFIILDFMFIAFLMLASNSRLAIPWMSLI